MCVCVCSMCLIAFCSLSNSPSVKTNRKSTHTHTYTTHTAYSNSKSIPNLFQTQNTDQGQWTLKRTVSRNWWCASSPRVRATRLPTRHTPYRLCPMQRAWISYSRVSSRATWWSTATVTTSVSPLPSSTSSSTRFSSRRASLSSSRLTSISQLYYNTTNTCSINFDFRSTNFTFSNAYFKNKKESVIDIEYSERCPPPEPLDTVQVDDWVSSIKGHSTTNQ